MRYIDEITIIDICNLKIVFRSLPCSHRTVRIVGFCLTAKKPLHYIMENLKRFSIYKS